ncbi:transporter [Tenacibaculum agarivorans]|uniref:transporter n=1 Tax=Tenacibaculum agarivorans TaxID=1908389 RepID=UPI00094BA72A|nr:transporter [Tenacibaculum agarivorans]
MKKALWIFLCLTGTIISHGQYQESIDSGRSGRAVTAFTVGKNIGQIEAGLNYLDLQQQFSTAPFLRYGLTETIELNGGVDYNFSDSEIRVYNFGAKFNIFEGDTMLPSSAFLINFNIPNNSEENPFSKVLFIFNFRSHGNLSITGNIGANIDLDSTEIIGEDDNGNSKTTEVVKFEALYLLNVGYQLSNKFSVFVEPYVLFNKFNNPKTNFNVNSGVTYLATKDILLDIQAGYSIADKSFTASLGMSWRFPF